MRLQIAVKRSSVRRILRGRQVERAHSRYASIEAYVCRGLGHVRVTVVRSLPSSSATVRLLAIAAVHIVTSARRMNYRDSINCDF